MARTLLELEKATQTALDAVAAAHKQLATVAAERDQVLIEAAEKAKAEAKGDGGTTVKVPAAQFKTRGA